MTSKVTYILTANYKQHIPEPILPRVFLFEIPKPDLNKATQIVKRINQMLLKESSPLNQRLSDVLPDDVRNLLAALLPRKMKLSIAIALGKVVISQKMQSNQGRF